MTKSQGVGHKKRRTLLGVIIIKRGKVKGVVQSSF